MPAITEDTAAIRAAIAYAIELCREITEENGAPTLGIQNQTIDFILANPALRDAVARWAQLAGTEEATAEPPRRLPCDDAYRRIRACLESAVEPPVFSRPGQKSADRR
jgi:hypothetical protein